MRFPMPAMRSAAPALRVEPKRSSTTSRPACSRTSSGGLPSATITPWSMTISRSQSCSASSMWWVVSTSVVPFSFSWNNRSHSTLRACGSRPVVGSSSSMMRGSETSARAIVRRRFMPPERSSTRASRLSASCAKSISSSALAASQRFGRPK